MTLIGIGMTLTGHSSFRARVAEQVVERHGQAVVHVHPVDDGHVEFIEDQLLARCDRPDPRAL